MSDRDPHLESLESALEHEFADRSLLADALRHTSAAKSQGSASNERLEFLGDAALNFAVAAILFARWPEASEGELTRGRAALVRERTLAEVADGLSLGLAIELAPGVDPTASVLADAVEAVLGALLLDAGWEPLFAAVRRLWNRQIEELRREDLAFEEAKSTLQEMAQKSGLPLPVYREVSVRGPDHSRIYLYEVEFDGEVVAQGEGSSKRSAQQEAARRALQRLAREP